MGKIKQQKNKKIKKNILEIVPKDVENEPLPATRNSDDPIPKKSKWINKQRVLVFGARGISYRDRHLMKDLKALMPHHRAEAKMERTKNLSIINEMCEMKHCNKAVLFEGRRKRDLYMWISNVPTGPSGKFLVENIHTMGELKLTGNCLRGSRPLLSFDKTFEDQPHLMLLKELLTQIFGIPNHHPKSQPFFDHIYTFTYLDKRIWFRNFQILSEDGALAEIGPRFVLNPVKIFGSSFGGETIWENGEYKSPAKHRQELRKAAKNKYINKVEKKVEQEINRPKEAYKFNEVAEVFEGDTIEQAMKIAQKAEQISLEEEKESIKVKPLKKKVKTTVDLGEDEIKRKVAKLQKIMKKQKPNQKKLKSKPKKIKAEDQKSNAGDKKSKPGGKKSKAKKNKAGGGDK